MGFLSITGDKDRALCCLPLGVAALIIGVVTFVLLATILQSQIAGSRHDHGGLDTIDIVTLVFQGIPCVCAFLIIPGVLCKSARLLKVGLLSLYPSMFSLVVSVVLMWISALARQHNNADENLSVDFIDSGSKDARTVALIQAGLLTLWHVLLLVVLCYVGDIIKSSSNQVAEGKSLWRIEQHPD